MRDVWPPDRMTYSSICFAGVARSPVPRAHAVTFGAAHCIDLPFFFGNIDEKEQWLLFSSMYRSFTNENRPGRLALSEAMVSYLAQFMPSGNPNSAVAELPEWQAWSNDVGGPKVLQLDADRKHAQIGMDSRELSIAGIRRAPR